MSEQQNRRKKHANLKEISISLATLFLSIFTFVVILWIIVAITAVFYNARF